MIVIAEATSRPRIQVMGGSDDTVDQVGEAVAPLIAAGLSRMKT